MIKYIKLFITCVLLFGCKSKVAFIKNNFQDVENVNCGGFISKTLKRSSLSKYVIIYGKVVSCSYKNAATNTLLKLYNEKMIIVDSLFTDEKGNYKLKKIAGTYKIKALHISQGVTETSYIDFNPQDSTQVDLFLSYLPSIKE